MYQMYLQCGENPEATCCYVMPRNITLLWKFIENYSVIATPVELACAKLSNISDAVDVLFVVVLAVLRPWLYVLELPEPSDPSEPSTIFSSADFLSSVALLQEQEPK